MAHTDKRAVTVLVRGGGNLLPLLVNVNAELFNSLRLRFALVPAIKLNRFVLKGNRLNFVGLILPGNSNETTVHSIDVVTRQTKNLR